MRLPTPVAKFFLVQFDTKHANFEGKLPELDLSEVSFFLVHSMAYNVNNSSYNEPILLPFEFSIAQLSLVSLRGKLIENFSTVTWQIR
jgi:hypothetical protein